MVARMRQRGCPVGRRGLVCHATPEGRSRGVRAGCARAEWCSRGVLARRVLARGAIQRICHAGARAESDPAEDERTNRQMARWASRRRRQPPDRSLGEQATARAPASRQMARRASRRRPQPPGGSLGEQATARGGQRTERERRQATNRPAARAGRRSCIPARRPFRYLGSSAMIQFWRKNTTNAAATTHIRAWISPSLRCTTLITTQEMNPAPMPTVMS